MPAVRGRLVRDRLNDNPMVTLALLGVMGIVVIFVFMSRMSSGSGSPPAAPATTTPATGAAPSTATPAAPTTATPAAPATATPTAPATEPSVIAAPGSFKPGPGLPKSVVDAYNHDKVVVLLVFKRNGIDDRDVRRYVDDLSAQEEDAAIFQTSAKHIVDYSRVTVGVNLSQVPAIVVLDPNRGHIDKNAIPKATVSYGFHGFDSIQQAIRDAQYKGPENLPAYPR